MKAIMVMFDSLNRAMLSPYGSKWVKTPNFERLAKKTVKFTNFYAGSLPCMPARRDLHTGRLNFLHRSWGPLEPFDDSMPQILKYNNVYTHMVSDHAHYWEEGGSNYHTKYNTWEFIRGQEGDPWKGEVEDPYIPPYVARKPGPTWRQDWVNRKYIEHRENMPQHRTFKKGIEFIQKNVEEDNWFLQIETFDPHEPFYTLENHKKLYPHNYNGPHFDWPQYRKVKETSQEIEHVRYEYAALVSMCDEYLGKVLDVMDDYQLWDDTLLIVNTDHGFLLGEHDWWAKVNAPLYNEVVHLPFFMWDPTVKRKNEECDKLVQTIDIAPTMLDYFNVKIPKNMQGVSLKNVLESNASRKAALFGIFGGHVNCTDRRYVYMRAPVDLEYSHLYNYTLMPNHTKQAFSEDELKTVQLSQPFSFTKGLPTMKTRGRIRLSTPENASDLGRPSKIPIPEEIVTDSMLFDLETDPTQSYPIHNPDIERKMISYIKELMKENDAPKEQFDRLEL